MTLLMPTILVLQMLTDKRETGESNNDQVYKDQSIEVSSTDQIKKNMMVNKGEIILSGCYFNKNFSSALQ